MPQITLQPTAIVADASVALKITGITTGSELLLRNDGGGGDVRLAQQPAGFDGQITATATLPAGRYALISNGAATGQFVTAAVAFPPRPLGFDDGAIISLKSVNFDPFVLHGTPARVTIDKPPAHARKDTSSFLVRSAKTRCGAASAFANAFILDSCAHPGLVLAHGDGDGSPMRLALDASPSASGSHSPTHAHESACNQKLLFSHRTPGLAGDGTTTLLAPIRAASSNALVARHSFSRLKLSATTLENPPPDAVLRDDASWKLAKPTDPTCAGRVAAMGGAAGGGGAVEEANAAGPSLLTASSTAAAAAALATPTHAITLHVSIGGKPTSNPLRFELFGNVAPRTVQNFVMLCTGDDSLYKGADISGASVGKWKYAGTSLQRVIPG